MAEQTNRKGGRRWWGKAQAKAAGRVTRRRDDRGASLEELMEEYGFTEAELDALPDEEDEMAGKSKFRVGFYVEIEVESYHDEEAWLVASAASNWPFPGMLSQPVRKEGYLNDSPVTADIVRAQPLMTKPVEEE